MIYKKFSVNGSPPPSLPSSGDPLSNMLLSFSSKEDAIAFAEKNGEWKPAGTSAYDNNNNNNNSGCNIEHDLRARGRV